MTTSQERRKALTALISATDIIHAKPQILLPASDYFDLAGEEFGARLLLTEGADGTQYCLRPDFTLPIAQTHMANGKSVPAAYGYLGPVFRQRKFGPTEFEQAGLELIAQPNADAALYRVFDFVCDAMNIYNIDAPSIRLGSVALFEVLLEAADMPDVWRPRLRRRFGNVEAMQSLLDRLSNPHGEAGALPKKSRSQLVDDISGQMIEAGLSLVEGRKPEDIADRYLEKQALAAAKVPENTVALLRNYLAISGALGEALGEVETLFKDADIFLEKQLGTLKKHESAIVDRLPDAQLTFETGFSPRLHYYTGLVFEIYNSDEKILVSGGQYDRLLQALGASKQVSASGCSLWVKRLDMEAAK